MRDRPGVGERQRDNQRERTPTAKHGARQQGWRPVGGAPLRRRLATSSPRGRETARQRMGVGHMRCRRAERTRLGTTMRRAATRPRHQFRRRRRTGGEAASVTRRAHARPSRHPRAGRARRTLPVAAGPEIVTPGAVRRPVGRSVEAVAGTPVAVAAAVAIPAALLEAAVEVGRHRRRRSARVERAEAGPAGSATARVAATHRQASHCGTHGHSVTITDHTTSA